MVTKGVGCIGQITKNCHVGKLSIMNCDLKHEELDSFMKHSDGAKVRNLRLRVIMRYPGFRSIALLDFCYKMIKETSNYVCNFDSWFQMMRAVMS